MGHQTWQQVCTAANFPGLLYFIFFNFLRNKVAELNKLAFTWPCSSGSSGSADSPFSLLKQNYKAELKKSIPSVSVCPFLLESSILQSIKNMETLSEYVCLVQLNRYSWPMSKFKTFICDKCLLTLQSCVITR